MQITFSSENNSSYSSITVDLGYKTTVGSSFYKNGSCRRCEIFSIKVKLSNLILDRLEEDCCCCSVIKSRPTLCYPMDCSMPAFPVLTRSWSLFRLMSIELVMPSNQLILCCPLLLLPSIFPSIRVFSSESAPCIRWPMYWSFSFSISSSNEYSGLISFGINWFDFLAVQGTLKSLLQHHSLKSSILQCSALFTVQLTSIRDYWKNHRFDYVDLCW